MRAKLGMAADSWFLSTAHTQADINRTVEITEKAFIEVRGRFAEEAAP